MTQDRLNYWMDRAMKQAHAAAKKGEVPVGAVLIREGKVLARAHNRTRLDHDPTAHAEMLVIKRASEKLRNERLVGCELFVTKEPCAMCAGAIVQARLPLVVFGAFDVRMGACGSALKVLPNKKLNHRPVVVKGIRHAEAAALLKDFFKERRKKSPAVK